MPMVPIATKILNIAITRIRAGETFSVVWRSLKIDKVRLRKQMCAKYSDFDALMQANIRHVKGDPVEPSPQKRTNEHGTWFKRDPGFLTQEQRDRQRVDHAAQQAELIAAGRHYRLMADFSTEELVELKAKVQVWVATGEALSGAYAPYSVMEG
jgi:hypothetical protein